MRLPDKEFRMGARKLTDVCEGLHCRTLQPILPHVWAVVTARHGRAPTLDTGGPR